MESENGEKRVVGYALEGKKVKSFMKESLVNHGRQRGIHFVPVDLNKPLVDQGPFHAILHKLNSLDWKLMLSEYKSKHPDVVILDDPAAVECLHNRVTMLDAVTHLDLHTGSAEVSFEIPKQVVVQGESEWKGIGLSMPVIAKPLEADGSETCHDMFLVLTEQGLDKVRPPVVLQEFVNHGGVVFKVYVAGDQVRCVARPSLPDFVGGEQLQGCDVVPFSRISNLNSNSSPVPSDVEMPELELVEQLATALRGSLKLNLFNFDLIRDARVDPPRFRYLVIDINYFPGYAKLPAFESFFIDFLCDLLNHHPEAGNTG